MPSSQTPPPTKQRSRQVILNLLKKEGPSDARDLAAHVGVSAMAVRQHLYALQNERIVTFDEQPQPVGRPVKLWKLTSAADRFFPDGHAELTVGLVQSMTQAFGAKGLEKLLAVRTREQIAAYCDKMPRRASLRKRLDILSQIRSNEGYMAEVIDNHDGSFLFVENHCPICAAATACTGLCGAELSVFQQVLGDEIDIERVEHIIEGARRCAYRVARKTKSAKRG